MNEVFAHAALMKHKNIVRYYNSWVEGGRVFIQNEFCEGGTLAQRLKDLKSRGKKFTEAELRTILRDILGGLKTIHNKRLAHLDIKPDNIFISQDETSSSTQDEMMSSDSGAFSEGSSSAETKNLVYKIGDLGHITSVEDNDSIPEEGDCRYMAPELLEMDVEKSNLPKADIFSLGLSIYELASLESLPKNSLESEDYNNIKLGKLKNLPNYSKQFNRLLKKMANPDPKIRPTAAKLHSTLTSTANNSKFKLMEELGKTKMKLAEIERLLVDRSEYS